MWNSLPLIACLSLPVLSNLRSSPHQTAPQCTRRLWLHTNLKCVPPVHFCTRLAISLGFCPSACGNFKENNCTCCFVQPPSSSSSFLFLNFRAFPDQKKARMGLLECLKHNVIQPYEQLSDKDGAVVVQCKAQVCVCVCVNVWLALLMLLSLLTNCFYFRFCCCPAAH